MQLPKDFLASELESQMRKAMPGFGDTARFVVTMLPNSNQVEFSFFQKVEKELLEKVNTIRSMSDS